MAFILFDEHLGQFHPAGEISFSRPTTTIRELIRARIELEVERTRDKLGELKGLVKPGPVEVALNGDRGAYGFASLFLDPANGGRLDVDKLAHEAEEAFLKGRYFLLLNDRQAESLDEVIDLAHTGEATFLLITPLQGG
jgi:hypothetical protein